MEIYRWLIHIKQQRLFQTMVLPTKLIRNIKNVFKYSFCKH